MDREHLLSETTVTNILFSPHEITLVCENEGGDTKQWYTMNRAILNRLAHGYKGMSPETFQAIARGDDD